MTKIGDVQDGFLAQWLFSIAGESDRDDVNKLGSIPTRLSVKYEYNFADGDITPKNAFRVTLVPLF